MTWCDVRKRNEKTKTKKMKEHEKKKGNEFEKLKKTQRKQKNSAFSSFPSGSGVALSFPCRPGPEKLSKGTGEIANLGGMTGPAALLCSLRCSPLLRHLLSPPPKKKRLHLSRHPFLVFWETRRRKGGSRHHPLQFSFAYVASSSSLLSASQEKHGRRQRWDRCCGREGVVCVVDVVVFLVFCPLLLPLLPPLPPPPSDGSGGGFFFVLETIRTGAMRVIRIPVKTEETQRLRIKFVLYCPICALNLKIKRANFCRK